MQRFILGFLGLVPTVALSGFYGNGPAYPDGCSPYGYNPPVAYLDRCDNGFFGSAELLYFMADTRIDYASVINLDSRTPDLVETADIRRARFFWDPGFRITLGYDLPCDQWAIAADYTYFRTHARHTSKNVASLTTGEGTFVIPAMGPFQESVPFIDGSDQSLFPTSSRVDFTGTIRLNQVTVYLDRKFNVTPCLTLDPYAGFKGLVIQQAYRDRFVADGINIQNGDQFSAFTLFRASDHFQGYGAMVGLKTYWDILSNLSLFVDFGTSLLATQSRVNFRYFDTTGTNPTFVQRYRLDEVGYTLDGGASLLWQQPLCNGGAFTVKLGWEAHYISDQNRLMVPNTPFTIPSKPLTLQGAVFGIGYSI